MAMFSPMERKYQTMLTVHLTRLRQLAGWLFVVMYCLVSSGISAADDLDAKTILIYAEINEPGLVGVAPDSLPGQSNFSLELYAMLRDILIAEGFTPVFIQASSAKHYPDFFEPLADYETLPNFWKRAFSISSASLYGGTADSMILTPFVGHQSPPLPMGEFGLASLASISIERPASLEEVARLSAGMALYTSYHCDHALPYLEEASTNPDLIDDWLIFSNTMFYRAACEYDQGQIENAITSYQAVLDYSYEDAPFDPLRITDYTAINLAWVYAQQGQHDQGLALLDAYATFDYGEYGRGGEAERFLRRADVYLALDAGDAAIAEITRLITIAIDQNAAAVAAGQPEVFSSRAMARLYAERGQRYWQLGQTELALADFDQAVQIDDHYPKTYYWRGVLYYDQQVFDQSRADLERFLALAPDYNDYYEEDLTPYLNQAVTYLAQLPVLTSP